VVSPASRARGQGPSGSTPTNEPKVKIKTSARFAYPPDFEAFWLAYPHRDGKPIGKRETFDAWEKLTEEQRRCAMVGAGHLAANGRYAKDPIRFLKPSKAGAFVFDDWQEPADPSLNGARASPGLFVISDDRDIEDWRAPTFEQA
jgi:hypothetical protein